MHKGTSTAAADLNLPNAGQAPQGSGLGWTSTRPPRGRRSIRLPASAQLFPGYERPILVVDVSVGGISCECDSIAKVGSQILVEIDGVGRIPALVRWSSGRRFGARFNGPLGVSEKQVIAKLVRMSLSEARADDPAGEAVPLENADSGRTLDDGAHPDWELELKHVHEHQLALLDELEEMTAAPAPNRSALADLRLQLTRATRARRGLLAAKVYPDLERRSTGRAPGMVARLRAKDDALRRLSAQHIGTWSLHAAIADWPGYCAASAKVRAAIRAQIAVEQEVIFLSRRSRGARMSTRFDYGGDNSGAAPRGRNH